MGHGERTTKTALDDDEVTVCDQGLESKVACGGFKMCWMEKGGFGNITSTDNDDNLNEK